MKDGSPLYVEEDAIVQNDPERVLGGSAMGKN